MNKHLKSVLTDYENLVFIYQTQIILQTKIKKFDARKDDFSIFDNCDILTMWGVDYALKDEDLLKIFTYIKNKKTKLIIASFDINHSFKIIKNLLKEFFSKRYQSFRIHGILRNEKYFQELCRFSDVKISTLLHNQEYRIFEIN